MKQHIVTALSFMLLCNTHMNYGGSFGAGTNGNTTCKQRMEALREHTLTKFPPRSASILAMHCSTMGSARPASDSTLSAALHSGITNVIANNNKSVQKIAALRSQPLSGDFDLAVSTNLARLANASTHHFDIMGPRPPISSSEYSGPLRLSTTKSKEHGASTPTYSVNAGAAAGGASAASQTSDFSWKDRNSAGISWLIASYYASACKLEGAPLRKDGTCGTITSDASTRSPWTFTPKGYHKKTDTVTLGVSFSDPNSTGDHFSNSLLKLNLSAGTYSGDFVMPRSALMKAHKDERKK